MIMEQFPFDLTTKPVYNRVQKVLQYCSWKIPHNDGIRSGVQIPIQTLQDHFGPNSNPLSVWLRNFLLIKSKNYGVDIKRCNEYTLNYSNWSVLSNHIGTIQFVPKRNRKDELRNKITKGKEVDIKEIDPKLITTTILPIMKKFPILSIKEATQVTTGNFQYSRGKKSNRYINSIQSIPTELRDQIFKEVGFNFIYDFEACAPTIFLHLAKRSGINDILLEPITDYLNNKEYYRSVVYDIIKTNDINRSKKYSKQILNGLFNGAKLAKTTYCTIYNNILKRNDSKMNQLQTHPLITSLIRSINFCWRKMSRDYYIDQFAQSTSFESRRRIIKNFYKKGSNKWKLYFEYEIKLIDIVTTNLDKAGINYFIEHDGFRTNQQVDIKLILMEIKLMTGISMIIKEEHF